MAKPIINQLNGGEISPWLEGRIDLPKYGYSAKLMRNFIPLVEGSLIRRGGSHYVASCKEVEAVTFTIVPTPSEADVYINNELTNEINCAPGEVVSYTVSCEGYQTVTGTYTVDDDVELEVDLLSQQYRNTFTIVPTPNDAEVYINGVMTTTTEMVRGATAYYRVVKDGYDTVEGSIVVNRDIVLPVELSMSFEIIAQPAGAIVTINGQNVSKIAVEPGDEVEWSVSLAGYDTQSGTVTISKSEILYVNLPGIYDLNEVIFEKSTAGTYTLDVKVAGWYNLMICSAGGGGGGSATKHSWKGSDGASGAAFIGKISLEKTKYTIKVGQGGAGGNRSGKSATNGQPVAGSEAFTAGITSMTKTDSSAQFNISMTPGLGGFGTGSYSSKPLAAGEITSWTGVTVQSQTLKSNGKIKSTVSLLGNGFGAGGRAVAASNGTPGTNGYVRLIYIGQV